MIREPCVSIRDTFQPEDIDYLIKLHGVLYTEEYGWDRSFESYVAQGLTEFVASFDPGKSRLWLAENMDRIIASIAIVGHSHVEAQLRWFLVDPTYRGVGLGSELLQTALQFCRERRYTTIFLWSTSELMVARHLYLREGFMKTKEITHEIWGKILTEEKYILDV